MAVADYFTGHALGPTDDSNPADWDFDLMTDQSEVVTRRWAKPKDAQAEKQSKAAIESEEQTLLATANHPSEFQRLVELIGLRLLYFWQERIL